MIYLLKQDFAATLFESANSKDTIKDGFIFVNFSFLILNEEINANRKKDVRSENWVFPS